MATIARTSLLRQAQIVTGRRLTSPATTFASSSSLLSRTQLVPKSFVASRTVPFSTSTQRQILPAGPQVVQGGVNDPAPVPKPSPTHGSYHWVVERALSVGLVPLSIAPFIGGTSMNPTLDAIFVAAILVHSHIGFQAVITDYIPEWRMPKVRKTFDWLLNLATLLVGIGFYEYETNDVGLCEGVKRVWRAGANDATIGKLDVSSLGHDGKLKHLKD